MPSTVDCYVFQDMKGHFTSLKELCAKTFLNMIEINKRLRKFPDIPPRLHIYLMEICIVNIFDGNYNANSGEMTLPHSMMELLRYWPYEDFILKQIVPYLPPRYRDLRIKIKDGIMKGDDRPFGSISFYLHKFYGILSDAIYEFVLTNSERYNIIGAAKKVDLTRRSYYVMYLSNCKFPPKKVFKILKRRANVNTIRTKWKSFRNKIMNNRSWSGEASQRKMELYVGLEFYDAEYVSAMKQILELNKADPGADISIQYKKVEMTHAPYDWLDYAQVLLDNEISYLQFPYGFPDDMDTLVNMCTHLSLLKSIRLEGIPLTSIKCFICLQNLTDLSLENINLNGQLGDLCDLNTGLIALRLEQCSLNNEDLDILAISHHTASLQELNISNNVFTDPIKESIGSSQEGLIGLLEKLTEVRLVNLHWLDLHIWSDLGLQALVNSIKDRPKLTILNLLGRNNFNDRVMTNIMTQLAQSVSLTLISLDLPRDVPNHESHGFHLRFMEKIHEIRGNDDLQVVSGHYHVTVISNLDPYSLI